jgi:hypothetical protein
MIVREEFPWGMAMLLRISASVCTPANREGSARTMNHFLDEAALIPAKDDWMDCHLA